MEKKEEMQIKLSRMGDGDAEVLYSQGLAGHSLVQFWIGTAVDEDGEYSELTLDPNKFYIIGCDEENTRKLLRYRTHFASCTIRLYDDDLSEEVISRVFKKFNPEMSPNICYYSEHEYPHTHFALSCGIRASFCFPFATRNSFGVLEIVSTRNQHVGLVRKFCESFEELFWGFSFQCNTLPEYAIPELDRLLEGMCQKFKLPLTQYWTRERFRLLRQVSCRDFENLAPWCQFKDACSHMTFGLDGGLLGNSCKSHQAFFCKDITALSITPYPFAHYARNCGSIACFTIYLEQYVLEFFLPSQELDNDYTQTLFNFIWATVRESLPNCQLASRKQLGQVLSVKVINSSTQTEPEFFKIGQPQSTLPHHEGSGHTRTLKLFENGPDHSSYSNSYEEAATGETSKRIPNEASQPRRSEEYFKTKGNTVAAERVDESVEESTIKEAPYATSNVDVGCATTNVDIRNAMTTASRPPRFQTMEKQQEETMILGNEGDTSQQLPRILQPLFEDGIEQDVQVLQMKRSTPEIYSYEEMCTAATSKKSPEYTERIISYELDEELPIKCNEPQSLTSQPRRSEEIFGDEGYTVASERVNEQVEKSLVSDEDVGYAMNIASQPFISGTMTSVPQQEFHKEIMVSENSAGKLLLLEDDTTIHFASKTSTEAHTSKGERKSEEDISFESLSKHFGRPLDDAATSFGVSRSTFKRICRDHGIKRWPYGKRRMDGDLSPRLTRRLKNEEPSRRNISYSGVTPVHDTVVARTGQDLNKMTVKVIYNTDNIRFELPSSSGIAELENRVIERLPLKRKSFSLKYQDEEDDWILIGCDKDVQECMKISTSLKKPTIKMLLGPPINNYTP